MSRRAFLRTIVGLDNKQTSRLTNSDYLVCQINGETVLRRVASNLAIPDGSVGEDQLDSSLKLLTPSSVSSLPSLGATAATLDDLVLYDQSDNTLKRVTAAQVVPDGTIDNNSISASAGIDRSKVSAQFHQEFTFGSDTGLNSSWSIIGSARSFTAPASDYYCLTVFATGNITGGAIIDVRAYLDGTSSDSATMCGSTASGTHYGSACVYVIKFCSAGTRTVRAEGKVAGSGTDNVQNSFGFVTRLR
jgi:hypothetical protein